MIDILDTQGEPECASLQDQWINVGQGFILVYSISSRRSFVRIQKLYNQISSVKADLTPVMLVGNKSDQFTEREVSTKEGQCLARELGCDFIEATAKNCINVEKVSGGFFTLSRHCCIPPVHSFALSSREFTSKKHCV